MTSTFDLTPPHLAAVAATALVAVALCVGARRCPRDWIGPGAAALGVFLVASEAVWIGWLVVTRRWTPAIGLPLQVCDAATVLGALALWTRRRALVELLYFWACAGTVQALLTPDAPEPFPGLLFFQYYAAHGGIVVAALVLVIGLRLSPGPGAVRRAALLTAAYAAGAGVADLLTGGDYLYLRRPPGVHTLFDLMGPWPWYILVAALVALVLFAVLAAPFRLSALSAARTDGSRPRAGRRRSSPG